MTRLMPRCECHQFPILECSDCAPTPDDLLDIAHDEPPPSVAVTLGAVACATVGAVIGAGLLLGFGILEHLLGKRLNHHR